MSYRDRYSSQIENLIHHDEYLFCTLITPSQGKHNIGIYHMTGNYTKKILEKFPNRFTTTSEV